MKAINLFFSLYRAVLYLFVIVFLLITVGPMAVGIRPFVVQSASMEPKIMTGALVYIQQEESKSPLASMFDYKEPEKGDIIAFKQGSGDKAITVVHRIHDINEKGDFIMKGDNNKTTDIATVSRENIVGQYKFNIPKLGYLAAKLTSKQGIIVAVALMLIAFISSFVADAADNKDNEEKEDKTENKEVNAEVQKTDIIEEKKDDNAVHTDALNDLYSNILK